MDEMELLGSIVGEYESRGNALPPLIIRDGELQYLASEYFPPSGVKLRFRLKGNGDRALKVDVSGAEWVVGPVLAATEFTVVDGGPAVRSGMMEHNNLRFRETLYMGTDGIMNHLVEIWRRENGEWASTPSYGMWICPP